MMSRMKELEDENRRLKKMYLSDLAEVQDFAKKWMWSYNYDHPIMALGGFTPKQGLAMAA
jgi:putative transposase